MAQELTAFVEAVKTGRLPLEVVIKKVAIYAYLFLQRHHRHEEDTASEIFCLIYPRIAGMIRQFQYRGIPFEVYLHMTIRRLTLTYYQKQKKQETLKKYSENTYCADRLSSPAVTIDEETPPHIEGRAVKYLGVKNNLTITHEHLRRRVLCLICKSAYEVSSEQIDRTAALAGVNPRWLEERIAGLRTTMAPRITRLEKLSRQRKETMAWEHIYHEHMEHSSGETERQLYRQRMNRADRRVKALSSAIQRIPLSPTHTEIARTLKIPKGSVDSGLHYIKNALSPKK